jgi:hypothetical protein
LIAQASCLSRVRRQRVLAAVGVGRENVDWSNETPTRYLDARLERNMALFPRRRRHPPMTRHANT